MIRRSCALLALSLVLFALPAVAAVTEVVYTSDCNLAIPDAAGYVEDTIDVPLGSIVVGIEVYLQITHSYSSDLAIRLFSPIGTEVRLFWIGEGGEPNTNPAGWYPADFTPKDDLADFAGEYTMGAWTIRAQDYSVGDAGTLNQWRLKVIYDNAVPGASSAWGRVKSLY